MESAKNGPRRTQEHFDALANLETVSVALRLALAQARLGAPGAAASVPNEHLCRLHTLVKAALLDTSPSDVDGATRFIDDIMQVNLSLWPRCSICELIETVYGLWAQEANTAALYVIVQNMRSRRRGVVCLCTDKILVVCCRAERVN